MHKSLATCASQYSWTTVIENPSNVKEIWRDMEFKHKRPYHVSVTEVNFVIILLNAQITFSPLVPP